jgi:hypothetical protein
MEFRLTAVILILILLLLISEHDQAVEATAANKRSRSNEIEKISIKSLQRKQGKVNSKTAPTELVKTVILKKSKTTKSGKNGSLKKAKEVSY